MVCPVLSRSRSFQKNRVGTSRLCCSITEGFKPDVGEVYVGIEAPKGELGFYIVSDGSAQPYRMKIRPPSFVNLQALPQMVEGSLLADVIAAIGTLDIVLGEIDR